MKIGYFKHWFQPPYSFVTFLKEEFGIEAEEIDYKKRGYLEGYDVVLIEQNGYNDFIENDEAYFRDYIKRGGICWFMHQDYRRWAKFFLPEEVGYPMLVHRYVTTVEMSGSTFKCYMMPMVEPAGRQLFEVPNKIAPEDMVYWQTPANTFGLVGSEKGRPPEIVKSAALSCAVDCDKWEVLGSYMDPVVTDGALVLQAKYGQGLYFWNQLLFPEVKCDTAERPFAFWRKYVPNVLAHFQRFLDKDATPYMPPQPPPRQRKRNYKMAIHLHSLEWYGGDSSLGTILAMMRYMKYDIATIAIKDAVPYHGTLDLNRFSDDKLLMLHGQEYHPFNWTEVNAISNHNAYHMLAMGTNADAYKPEFTRSFFSTEEIKAYLHEAIDYVHSHGGAVCATHPYFDYWKNYDYDGVDKEHLTSLEDSMYEKVYAEGRHIAMMNSVDLFGVERLVHNLAQNFIYVEGELTRDSVVAAIRAGHNIAAAWFDEVDVTLDGKLPGDTVELKGNSAIAIHAKALDSNIRKLRLFSGGVKVLEKDLDVAVLDEKIPLAGLPLKTYVRVEIEGDKPTTIAVTTPFYL